MSIVRADFGQRIGKVRPLHGVNNGPVGYGGLVDISHLYKEINVPYVRLHDPNWPHPREVDIHTIFPNFDADPGDPASYDFDRTDRYIRRILDTGAKVVYRLGTSIEHTERKYYTQPPADFDRWARICIGIIRHYMAVFPGGVTHWEIWNEPETAPGCMWSGTFEQYLELYKTASAAIKAAVPEAKVGGFAASHPDRETVPQFLEFCRENNLPLDFFSWHTYAERPEQYAESSRIVRDALEQYGFGEVEVHLNEWNYMPGGFGPIFEPGNEYNRREVFEQQKSEIGASFAAATLILLQDERVDVVNYYDGQPMALYCGLFDYYGVPQKTYRAFKAFSRMLEYPERVKCEASPDDGRLYALAAADTDSGKAAVLISRFDGALDRCRLDLAGLPGPIKAEVLMLDKERSLEPVGPYEVDGDLEFQLRRHAVALVLLSPTRG